MNTLIKRPLITEKSMMLASTGWYTFEVSKSANKKSVASDVARLFSVSVLEVRLAVKRAKAKRAGKRMIAVKKQDTKKAYVRLKAGQSIDAFQLTQEGAKT